MLLTPWLGLRPRYALREDRASNLSNAQRNTILQAGFTFYQPYPCVRLDRKAGQIHLVNDHGVTVALPWDPLVVHRAPRACYLNPGYHDEFEAVQRAMVTQAGLAFYRRYLVAEATPSTVTLVNDWGKEITLPNVPGLVVSA